MSEPMGEVNSARAQLGAIPLRFKRNYWKVEGYPIMCTDRMVELAAQLRQAARG